MCLQNEFLASLCVRPANVVAAVQIELAECVTERHICRNIMRTCKVSPYISLVNNGLNSVIRKLCCAKRPSALRSTYVIKTATYEVCADNKQAFKEPEWVYQ